MPRKLKFRNPEEEEEYRAKRRQRNTEIQRERRRRIKQCSNNTSPANPLPYDEEMLNEVIEYIRNYSHPSTSALTTPSPLPVQPVNAFEMLTHLTAAETTPEKTVKEPSQDEERTKLHRRIKNKEAQQRRRALLKQQKQSEAVAAAAEEDSPPRSEAEESAYLLLRRRRNTECQRRRRQKLREEKLLQGDGDAEFTSLDSANWDLKDSASSECSQALAQIIKICSQFEERTAINGT